MPYFDLAPFFVCRFFMIIIRSVSTFCFYFEFRWRRRRRQAEDKEKPKKHSTLFMVCIQRVHVLCISLLSSASALTHPNYPIECERQKLLKSERRTLAILSKENSLYSLLFAVFSHFYVCSLFRWLFGFHFFAMHFDSEAANDWLGEKYGKTEQKTFSIRFHLNANAKKQSDAECAAEG